MSVVNIVPSFIKKSYTFFPFFEFNHGAPWFNAIYTGLCSTILTALQQKSKFSFVFKAPSYYLVQKYFCFLNMFYILYALYTLLIAIIPIY